MTILCVCIYAYNQKLVFNYYNLVSYMMSSWFCSEVSAASRSPSQPCEVPRLVLQQLFAFAFC